MAKTNQEESKKAVFDLSTTLLRKLKYIAFADETTQVKIVDQAISDYIDKWERKNGKIPSK